MISFNLILRCVGLVGLATLAHAQAAVEYAAKSSEVLGAGGGMHLGACPVDSMLVPCLKQSYPTTFYFGIVAICIALGYLVYPKSRA